MLLFRTDAMMDEFDAVKKKENSKLIAVGMQFNIRVCIDCCNGVICYARFWAFLFRIHFEDVILQVN